MNHLVDLMSFAKVFGNEKSESNCDKFDKLGASTGLQVAGSYRCVHMSENITWNTDRIQRQGKIDRDTINQAQW